MDLLLLAALGAFVIGFVLRPVFSRQTQTSKTPPDTTGELERLAEQKARILDALKDLEFEHETGKLSDADYQRVRSDDVAQVARIIARMDELSPTDKPKPPSPKAKQEEAPKSTCPSCGQDNPPGAKFCLRCGKPFEISVECPGCGTKLPAEARFCINCGTDVRG